MTGLFMYETCRFAFNPQYKIVTYKTQIISFISTKKHENISFFTAAVRSFIDRL